MKVMLPSHGALGQRCIRLSTPTLRDMLDMSMFNKNAYLRIGEIVERLTDADLKKITWFDACYIYDLASFTIVEGTLKYRVTCSKCKETYDVSVPLNKLDIEELDEKRKFPHTIRVNGEKYQLHLLSARDVLDAVEYSLYADDEEMSFNKSKVALLFGHDHKDHDFVDSLTVSEASTAIAFERYYYHGFVRVSESVCPKCGEETPFTFDSSVNIFNLPLEKVMDMYANVSSFISMEDMMRLSTREFNAMCDAINKKYESSGQ